MNLAHQIGQWGWTSLDELRKNSLLYIPGRRWIWPFCLLRNSPTAIFLDLLTNHIAMMLTSLHSPKKAFTMGMSWLTGALWRLYWTWESFPYYVLSLSTATAKSLQSCPTLCNPIDGSPPGSPIPGILQARILEWVAISFSNAWKWKAKGKSLSRVQLLATP